MVPYNLSDPKKQIQYLANTRLNLAQQREQMDLLRDLDQMYVNQLHGAPELEATIQSMEVAFRMQTEAPEVFDTRKEVRRRIAKYGEGGIGRGCSDGAPAGREGRAVRTSGPCRLGPPRRHHGPQAHRTGRGSADRRAGAGSQGSRPARRDASDRRQRVRPHACDQPRRIPLGSQWAGSQHLRLHRTDGGRRRKPGTIYGATDDFGFKVAENPVHVHDLHATALHLLGMDHEKLTYRYAGRNFRLTDVEGRVVKEILT